MISHDSIPNDASTAHNRLLIVAELLATGLMRLRQRNSIALHLAVDLDNEAEERVYVPTFKPPLRRERTRDGSSSGCRAREPFAPEAELGSHRD